MTKEVDSVALEVEQLMADYPSVVNSSKKLPKARHQVKHVIETTGLHPVKAHYRRLDKDKYSSPYKVLERGNKSWKLQVGERVDVVCRDHLKPHLGSLAPKAAVPPTRGRPRTASVASVASPSLAEKPGGPV